MTETKLLQKNIYVPEGEENAGRVEDINTARELAYLEDKVGLDVALKREAEIVKGVDERQQIKLDIMELFEKNIPDKVMTYVNEKGERSLGILLDNTQGEEIGKQAKVLLMTKDNFIIKNGASLWADLDPNRSPAADTNQIKKDIREALDASGKISNHETGYSQEFIVAFDNSYQDIYEPLSFFSKDNNKNMKIIIKYAMKIPEKYLDINKITDEAQKKDQMNSLKSVFLNSSPASIKQV